MKHSLTVLIASAAFTTGANAALVAGQTIGVDIGDTAVAPASNFNVVATGPDRPPANEVIADAIDITGSNTGVGITVDTLTEAGEGSSAGQGGHNGDTNDSLVGLPSIFQVEHVTDWVFRLDSVLFTGLDDSLLYEVTFVIGGFTGDGASNGQTVTIDGQTASLGDISDDPRFATLTGLSSTGGELLVDLAAPDAVLPVGSALTLTAVVPEPGSLALLGLGGIVMLRRRRD